MLMTTKRYQADMAQLTQRWQNIVDELRKRLELVEAQITTVNEKVTPKVKPKKVKRRK